MDVVNEKFSASGYRAQLDVTFNPNEVSRILGVGIVEPTKEIEKFLIIPIVLEADKVRIWKHQWWDNWNNYRKDTVILPVRDLQDLKELKEEDLAKNDLKGLQSMATRYGANNIVIVQADYKKDKNALEVQLEKIRDKQKTVVNYEYPGDERVTEKDLFAAAANDIAYRLDNNTLTDQAPSAQASAPTPAPAEHPAPATHQPMDMATPTPVPDAAPTLEQPPVATPNQPTSITVTKDGVKPTGALGNTGPVTSSVDTPDFGEGGGLSYTDIYVNAPDLLTWNRVRNKIVNTQGVRDMQIKSFTAGRAYVTVGHSVNLDQIKSSLESQNFEVMSDGQKLTIRER
jgi:hypothetical protein